MFPQAVLAANPNGFPPGSFVPVQQPMMPPPAQFAQPFPQPPAPQPVVMPVQNIAAEPQPRPRIRMQAPEEPAAAIQRPLEMPPPEAFGLAPKAPANVNWNAARSRLQQLGASAFRIDPVGDSFRVRILLPTNQSGGLHEVETTADSQAAAVDLALEQAERWKNSK
jgi:hypothetical protein